MEQIKGSVPSILLEFELILFIRFNFHFRMIKPIGRV